ncbi:hypothetical protein OROHE_020051 [Orobanche hederae]
MDSQRSDGSSPSERTSDIDPLANLNRRHAAFFESGTPGTVAGPSVLPRPTSSSYGRPTGFFHVPEGMILHSARVSSKIAGDSSSATSATGEPSTKKRTRGPNSGKALTAQVERSGRLRLVKPDGGVDSHAAGKYASRVGGLIRDKVHMVWPECSEVPKDVKNQVYSAMSMTWFEIPDDRQDLLHTYCHKIQAKRYSEWKYDLHKHFLKYGDGRDGTPLQFERREYEWLHLKACHFNNPNSKARGTINAANRAQNTVPHHGGSRTFERWFEISAEEIPEGNRYVEAFKKRYSKSLE